MPAPHKKQLSPEERAILEDNKKRKQILDQTKRIIRYIQNSGYEEYMQKDLEQMNSTIDDSTSLSLSELQERMIAFNRTASSIEKQKIKDEENQTTNDLLRDFGNSSDQSMNQVLNGADAQIIHAHTLETMDAIMSSPTMQTDTVPSQTPKKIDTSSMYEQPISGPEVTSTHNYEDMTSEEAVDILKDDVRRSI